MQAQARWIGVVVCLVVFASAACSGKKQPAKETPSKAIDAARAKGDSNVTTKDQYLILRVRSMRILDSYHPKVAKRFPEVTRTRDGQNSRQKLEMDYSNRAADEQPALRDSVTRVAIRASQRQSTSLELGDDYQILLQTIGFEERDGVVALHGRFKSNYSIQLPDYRWAATKCRMESPKA